ncbi:hypothetical protein Bhyg_06776 [Pseudolycoriella hygida]|uniref:Uncharacterized protein n=1 Tax=Pseudolycoriella hygida TaxID=35572 RepID=A0A9Q0N2D5_9DIPT|nr:hypothetical protein Bhyg_06776 [Pseudolycoriella hygida]
MENFLVDAKMNFMKKVTLLLGVSMLMLVIFSDTIGVSAGSCSISFTLCPDPQRKCISFSQFEGGYQCVPNCDECKKILGNNYFVWHALVATLKLRKGDAFTLWMWTQCKTYAAT